MSTPLAASTTAVIQELVEKGVTNFPNETQGNTPLGHYPFFTCHKHESVNESVPNFIRVLECLIFQLLSQITPPQMFGYGIHFRELERLVVCSRKYC